MRPQLSATYREISAQHPAPCASPYPFTIFISSNDTPTGVLACEPMTLLFNDKKRRYSQVEICFFVRRIPLSQENVAVMRRSERISPKSTRIREVGQFNFAHLDVVAIKDM